MMVGRKECNQKRTYLLKGLQDKEPLEGGGSVTKPSGHNGGEGRQSGAPINKW